MGVVTDVGTWDVDVAVGRVCGEIIERCGVEVVFGVAESRDMKRKWAHRRCSALRVAVVSNRKKRNTKVWRCGDTGLTTSAEMTTPARVDLTPPPPCRPLQLK